MAKQRGFSLLELLVVVGIILVIAAIATPIYLRARTSASEASAVASARSIHAAEITYAITYDTGFSADLRSLGGHPPCIPKGTTACLIDPELASSGLKGAYGFEYVPRLGSGTTASPFLSYSLSATPMSSSQGESRLTTDETGFIRREQWWHGSEGPNAAKVGR